MIIHRLNHHDHHYHHDQMEEMGLKITSLESALVESREKAAAAPTGQGHHHHHHEQDGDDDGDVLVDDDADDLLDRRAGQVQNVGPKVERGAKPVQGDARGEEHRAS